MGKKEARKWARAMPLTISLMFAFGTPTAKPEAQTFNSGSDGSDGAITLSANLGTVVFDPVDVARWGRVLDADGDGIYNFTTITIGSGTTLQVRADKVNRPLYWLASGNVVIAGILDVSGNKGTNFTTDQDVRRQLSIPGPGGYAGGAGGRDNPPVPATAGDGPGGGTTGLACTPTTGFVTTCGRGGGFTGNRFLIPLVGGSGGGGAVGSGSLFGGPPIFGFGGGAGGGAVLIARSTSVTVNGSITAVGGDPGNTASGGSGGGAGAGGAIRIVAPTVSGNGTLSVNGGSGAVVGGSGQPGWVRLEAFQLGNSFTINPLGAVMRGSPIDPTSLRPASSIRVTAVNGSPVPPNPTGSFAVPDVSISSNTPVNIEIAATGIPPGTVVTLQVYPQSPLDPSVVNLPTAQATLSGTIEFSTATAAFTFPYGFSRGFVRATWTQ